MSYKLLFDTFTGKAASIVREADGAFIPFDPRNSDYQAFLKWNAGKPSDPSKINPFMDYRPDDVLPLDLNSAVPVTPPAVLTEQVFTVPVFAPDFIVHSPKPKTKPNEALAEAALEAAKSGKSIASITLNLMVYLADLEKRVKKLGG